MYNYIRINLHEYIEKGKLFLFNKAVSNKAGTTNFHVHEEYDASIENQYGPATFFNHTEGSTITDYHIYEKTKKAYEVETISLSEFITSLKKKIDLVKIDIEGSEYDILEDIIENKTYKKITDILAEFHYQDEKMKQRAKKINKLIKDNNITNIDTEWV